MNSIFDNSTVERDLMRRCATSRSDLARKNSGDVLIEALTLTRHTTIEHPRLMDALVVDCIRDIFGMKGIAR